MVEMFGICSVKFWLVFCSNFPYVTPCHTGYYKIFNDVTMIILYIAATTMEYCNIAKETMSSLAFPFSQYIIVLQYYAGGNCSSAGAHVVHSNCACTRSVNIATYSELYNAVYATNVRTIPYSLSLVFSSLFIVYLFLLMVIGISLPSQMQMMSGSHSEIQRITTTVL